MSKDYSDHYACDEEWRDGAEDCEPPEPGKLWLTITEDGEEIAVLVLRADTFGGRHRALKAAKGARLKDARRIVAALNAYKEEA